MLINKSLACGMFVQRLCVLAAICIFLLCGCAARDAWIKEVRDFAEAGVQFTESVPAALDESLRMTIEMDSIELANQRDMLDSREMRMGELVQNDQVLQERAELLADLKRHIGLFRRYFEILRKLSAADSDRSALIEVSNAVVERLQALSPKLAAANIGGRTLSDSAGQVVSFAFATYQSRALNEELRRHAGVIDKELRLLGEAFLLLAESARSDMERQVELKYWESVVLPYIGEGSLPANWVDTRQHLLMRKSVAAPMDNAARAAETLRTSFIALVEGKLDHRDVTALLEDIGEILSYVGKAGNGGKES